MTLVSSTYIMGYDNICIVEGRSFMYVMKSKGPKIDPWGTPCVAVPQLEMKFGVALDGFISTSCFLFVK
jgi:hypothetical protein